MATYKTPEELRAWSRSFDNKSKVIKRGFYNYIDPEEEKKKKEQENENLSNISDEIALSDNNNEQVSDADASALASSIISMGNASSANIDALFALDASTIDEMNSKFPTTEEQLSQAKTESPVTKK